jgi:kynureninase
MSAHLASLDIFDEAGMDRIGEKRDLMTAYLEFVIEDVSKRNSDRCKFEIITPTDKIRRGAQLSILAHGQGKSLFDALTKKGVIADWREPNVIRVAPTPLYNSFEDCYNFGLHLEGSIH